jgi:hypothetical protein
LSALPENNKHHEKQNNRKQNDRVNFDFCNDSDSMLQLLKEVLLRSNASEVNAKGNHVILKFGLCHFISWPYPVCHSDWAARNYSLERLVRRKNLLRYVRQVNAFAFPLLVYFKFSVHKLIL